MIRLPSIRSKLLALFLVAGAIPIVAVSLLAYFNSVEAVDEMVANRTGRLAASIHDDLDRKVARRADDRIFWMNRPVQRFLGAALTQAPLGAVLDARWAGAMVEGARSYPVDAYRATFTACAAFVLGAALLSLLLRETRGRNVYADGAGR